MAKRLFRQGHCKSSGISFANYCMYYPANLPPPGSPRNPLLVAPTCAPLASVKGCNITGVVNGTCVATITCQFGYVTGASTYNCTQTSSSTASWTGTAPTCTRMCGPRYLHACESELPRRQARNHQFKPKLHRWANVFCSEFVGNWSEPHKNHKIL